MTKPCPKCRGKKVRACHGCKKTLLTCSRCGGRGEVGRVAWRSSKQIQWVYDNYEKIKHWSAPSIYTEMRRLNIYKKSSNAHDSVISIGKYMELIGNEKAK